MTETREASLAALRNREKTSALKTESNGHESDAAALHRQKERWVSNQSDEIEGQRELSACHN